MKNCLMTNINFCVLILAFLSCYGKTEENTQSTTQTQNVAAANADFYFTFTVDGKEMSFTPDDVSSSYNTALKKPTFKIFAGGGYGKIAVTLTTTADMTKPSSTPSGSTDYDEQITQGSVSLQNYPEKNYAFNSFDTGDAATSTPVPDAIVITKSERITDGRIITGTFNVKVFGGDNKQNDPNIKDRVIKGKFRMKHIFTDAKF